MPQTTAVFRPDLGVLAFEYSLTAAQLGFIAHSVLPPFYTPLKTATYPVIPAEALLEVANTARASRTAYARGDWEFEPKDYMPRDTTTERIDAVSLQVMVFGAGSLQVEELASAALELFEGRVISGVGLAPFELSRGEDVPTLSDDDGVWQAGVQLSGYVETIS